MEGEYTFTYTITDEENVSEDITFTVTVIDNPCVTNMPELNNGLTEISMILGTTHTMSLDWISNNDCTFEITLAELSCTAIPAIDSTEVNSGAELVNDLISFTQAPFEPIVDAIDSRMVTFTAGNVYFDSITRKSSNSWTVPNNSDFCFTVKVDSTENIYDDEYEQQNVKLTFPWCTPQFPVSTETVEIVYIVGTGQLTIPIQSKDTSSCSSTEFTITKGMN